MNRTASWAALAALAAGLVTVSAVQAQAVGQVEFARGVGYAQTPGQGARILGKGLELREGDTLSTAEGASAVIRMQDGTRMTLRPGTDMVVQRFQYREGATNNSMVMQLFSGGLRAITGLISKGSPDAAQLQTRTATIGIRGTDFDARLCQNDCAAESSRVTESARPNAVQASAKLVSTQGEINAVDTNGTRRRLVDGGAIYPGETVETGPAARGVLAFRDDSRLTLGATTRFKVDTFVFDDKNPGEGKFLVSLLRGSMRALTGLIGKANNRNVGFTTATATVGIRGTGLDMQCDEACSFFTWLGTIEVTPSNPGQGGGLSALQVLSAGQGLFVSPTGIRALPAPPPEMNNLPRPDDVPVDTKQLFSATNMPQDQEGLYVFVRDGHIQVTTASEVLHLGKGEAGFANPTGQTLRPLQIPLFLDFDRTPRPDSTNPMLQTMLNETVNRPANQCR
ncbi:MAG: FecR domain-containing protein [Rhodoferax sp.]